MRNTVFRIRQAMGMSTSELAKRMGVHVRSVQRWEAREYSPSPMAEQKLREVVHARRLEVEQERAARGTATNNNGNSSSANKPADSSPDEHLAESGPVRRGFLPSMP